MRSLFLIFGLFSIVHLPWAAGATGWSGFPIPTNASWGVVSNCVKQLIAAADERKTLLVGTYNPLFTNFPEYIEVTNAWISSYLQFFPGTTTTVSTNSYSNATQGAWMAVVTNYYLNVSNIVFTNEARADKVPALLQTIDALTILFLASKNVADLSKQVDGKFDAYCAPYITTNGTWNTNGYWELATMTNAGRAPPVHTLETYLAYLSGNNFDGSPLLTNFTVATSAAAYSNNVEGWTVGQMNTHYVPVVGVATSYTTYMGVMHQPRRLSKPFQLGEATYGLYNWKDETTYPSHPQYWPTWVDVSTNLMSLDPRYSIPFPDVGKLVFTGFQDVAVSIYNPLATNAYPFYVGVVATNPSTLTGWKGVFINGRIYLFQGTLGNFENYHFPIPHWIVYSLNKGYLFSWSQPPSLYAMYFADPVNWNTISSYCHGGTCSDEWVMQLGWKYTHLNDAWLFKTELIIGDTHYWQYGSEGLVATNGYNPTRIEYRDSGDTNYPGVFPAGSELVMRNRQHQPEGVPNQFSIGAFTNTIFYSGVNLLLTNSFVGLDGVSISNMNVLVTNTFSGRYTNAFRMRGATITFWASNTYEVYSSFLEPGLYASYSGPRALVQCPDQLNARYYMLENLNGTWEVPAIQNDYESYTGPGYSTSVNWATYGQYPATTNDFLNWVSWFSGPEADCLPTLLPYTNLTERNLAGNGLSVVSDSISAGESSHWYYGDGSDDGMYFSAARGFNRLGEEHAYLNVSSKIKGKAGELYRKFGLETVTSNGVADIRPLQGYQQILVVSDLSDPVINTSFPYYSYQRPSSPYDYRYEPLNGQDIGIGDTASDEYWNGNLDDWGAWGWIYDSGGGVYGKGRGTSYLYQRGQNTYKALVYWDFEY